MISRRMWWVLALFPLAFFAVNRAWMYSTQDFPDAWMYTGYFVHPELLYPRMPEAYQGTRVLHIVVGWLANRWLPVKEAVFAQKTVIFYANLWLLFGVLHRWFRNERAALIGAVLGVTNGLMIYLLSWNYVFNTTTILLTGTLWAQARMREGGQGWRKWAMLAGAFYVGGVWTYLPMAFAAPMVFALFVYGLPERTIGKLWAGLGWAALGGVLSMVVQGLISMGLGGPFWYFLPQLQRAEGYLLLDPFIPIEYWWREATWLLYLMLAVVLAGLGLWKGGGAARGWRERLAEPLPVVSGVFIFGFFWFVTLHATGVHQMLQNCEQSSFLYPFAFLVIGGWVAWLLEGMEEWRQWVVAGVALGGVLLMYGWLGHFWPARWVMPWSLLLVPAVLGAGMIGAGATRPGVTLAAALVFVGSLAGLNEYLAERRFLSPSSVKSTEPFNEVVYGAVRMIDIWDREGEVWFWDGLDRPNGRLHRKLNFFYNWSQEMAGERFPGLIGGAVHPKTPYADWKFKLAPGMRVLLFDTQPNEMAKAQTALAERGMQLRPLAQAETTAGGGLKPTRMELWETVPLGQTQGVALDVSAAETAEGVTRTAAGNGTEFIYPAGEKTTAWELKLPEGIAPTKGAAGDWIKLRIGANERRLRLILADEKRRPLTEVTVDPGSAVRDWWVELKPGEDDRYLQVRPTEPDVGGSFVVESAEY